jgi:hypothetical protein
MKNGNGSILLSILAILLVAQIPVYGLAVSGKQDIFGIALFSASLTTHQSPHI